MELFDIHKSALGKKISTPEHYDASLLFRIPRSENRLQYDLDDNALPFVGFDVWNCYEVSFLLDNGLPVSRMMKMVYPANSHYLVESKSLKVYLNAFNMDSFGTTVLEAELKVVERIQTDLSHLLETKVQISFFTGQDEPEKPFSYFRHYNLSTLIDQDIQEKIVFSRFTESPELLKSQPGDELYEYFFRSDMLRSNCRVTNQPDWGDLFVRINTTHKIDLSSVMQYLVSFRKENHFHEEVVEMIYKRFTDAFHPDRLMVAAMYTRRGGIDINPIRASHADWLDSVLIDPKVMVQKTLRQ